MNKDLIIQKQKELIKFLDYPQYHEVREQINRLKSELAALESEQDEPELNTWKEVKPIKCDHPYDKRELYHDGATICRQCNCIIAQNGRWLKEPDKLSML